MELHPDVDAKGGDPVSDTEHAGIHRYLLLHPNLTATSSHASLLLFGGEPLKEEQAIYFHQQPGDGDVRLSEAKPQKLNKRRHARYLYFLTT